MMSCDLKFPERLLSDPKPWCLPVGILNSNSKYPRLTLNSLPNLFFSLPKQMVVLIPTASLTLFSILPLNHSCQPLGVPLSSSLGPPVFTLASQPGSLGSGNPNGSLLLLAFFQSTRCTTTSEPPPKWNWFRLEWHPDRWGWLPPLVFPQSFSHKAFLSILKYHDKSKGRNCKNFIFCKHLLCN